MRVMDRNMGASVARAAAALLEGKGVMADAALYAERFRDPVVAGYFRAKSEDAVLTTDGLNTSEVGLRDMEFLALLARAEVLGKFGQNGVPDLRRVPFAVPVAPQQTAATAGWVGEAITKPLSLVAFEVLSLPHSKLAVTTPLSAELAKLSRPSAERAIAQALVASIAEASDAAFLDPSVAEDPGVSPASITNGAPSTASTGDVRADVAALIAGTTLDLADAVLVMSPANVPGAVAQAGAGASFGIGGGRLFGIPTVVSTGIGANVALIHASRILVAADEGITLDTARHATVETEGGDLVSLWQKNASAIRAERGLNFRRAHDEAVQLVTGAAYVLAS